MTPQSLESYLPPNTWVLLTHWMAPYPCSVLLTRPRATKRGDFRPPREHRPAVITLNNDLPPFEMLLTLTHEIAHLINWSQNGPRVRSHGPEWKAVFSVLLEELAQVASLPQTLQAAFRRHAQKPKSSCIYDLELTALLRKLNGNPHTILDEIELGEQFVFRQKRFKKLSSQRTRCICQETQTGQRYRIAKIAEVQAM